MNDRELLTKIEEVRASMNAQLDELIAAVQASHTGREPTKRRAPMRPPIGGPVLITTDIVRAKARSALEHMGIARVRG